MTTGTTSKCKLAKIMDKLDPAARSRVEVALTQGVANLRIVGALRLLSHDVNYETVRKHRNGVCACR